jgi:zinc transport system substrate-binding protein
MFSSFNIKLRATLLSLFAALAVAAVACGTDAGATPTSATATGSPAATAPAAPQLNVVTTIYPVTYFAQRIGGDRVQVTSLIKPGVEAHDFEPTPGDIRTIAGADVLVYNHPAFEGWIEDAVPAANNSGLVVVKAADLPDDTAFVDDHGHGDEEAVADAVRHVIGEVEAGDITAAEGIEEIEALLGGHEEDEAHSEGEEEAHLEDEILHVIEEVEGGQITAEAGIEEIEALVGGHEGEEGHEDDGHGHEEGGVDPHVWLNPQEAIAQVRAIEAAFAQADAAGTAFYRANADVLVAELEALDGRIAEGLASCQFDHMVVSHLAYGHLAEGYGIEQIGLSGLSTEFESGPQQITAIVNEMRELGIMHILQEPIADDRLAQTVAAETGATVLPLHPLEALTPEELAAGDTYFTVMERNLESLKTALRCG